MFSLENRTALVTGASGGIGEAIAIALHKAGATVALSGTKVDKLSALQQKLAERAVVAPGDLSSAEGAAEMFKTAEAALGGRIDILVNNAGLTKDNLSMRMSDEEWQKVLDVDLTAAFRLTRTALKSMMKARFGRIINITSIVGVTGNPGQANYCAAKAGLIGMSKAIAAEIASRNVTVNCIAPGFIATAMTDALTDAQKEAINVKIPAQKMGTPDDIAAGCVYLASNEAGYVTGQTLHINGGMAMI